MSVAIDCQGHSEIDSLHHLNNADCIDRDEVDDTVYEKQVSEGIRSRQLKQLLYYRKRRKRVCDDGYDEERGCKTDSVMLDDDLAHARAIHHRGGRGLDGRGGVYDADEEGRKVHDDQRGHDQVPVRPYGTSCESPYFLGEDADGWRERNSCRFTVSHDESQDGS